MTFTRKNGVNLIVKLFFVIQPVCFADETLFIYFAVEAHISALAGRIFVILVSFDRFRCNFCFLFRHLTDLPQKFHKGLKAAKI